MFYERNKKILVVGMLCLLSIDNILANTKPAAKIEKFIVDRANGTGFCGLSSLCAERIKSQSVQTDRIKTTTLCAVDVSLINACIDKTIINDAQISRLNNETICANAVAANNICANTLTANTLCTPAIQADDLCVTDGVSTDNICVNQAQIDGLWTDYIAASTIAINGTLEHCTPYKAHLSLSTTTVYHLGDEINWDVILDDPNGDVIAGPTRYVVPKTGYYLMTLGVTANQLEDDNSNDVIAGIPVVRPEIVVNDIRTVKAMKTFLSFGSEFQSSVLSGVFPLQAGDEVTCRYRVFHIDALLGITPFDGIVDLQGFGSQGQPDSNTYFIIHYLSSFCPVDQQPNPVECQPCLPVTCPPCNTVCPPVNIVCPVCPESELVCCACQCVTF
jgi:hypothetical protein